MLGRLTPRGNEFIRELAPGLDELSQTLSRSFKTAFKGRDANLVTLDSQVDLISDIQTKGISKGRGDHHAAFPFDAASYLLFHGGPSLL
jgi:hypothetical protein